jgi:uncharacterized repeat protein (TIGR03803 family)
MGRNSIYKYKKLPLYSCLLFLFPLSAYRRNFIISSIALFLLLFPLSVYSQGFLYGTTYAGGKNNFGVLFRYNIATGKDTVLLNFDSAYTGAYPLAGLMQASNGLLYGNTYEGGGHGYGTIFSYNPATGKDSVWKNFDSVHDGCFPIGPIMQSSSGLLYGTAVDGAKGFGVLYSLNIISGLYKVEYAFDSLNGAYPWDAPAEAADGKLYGTTNSGGSLGEGVIFCYNPTTGKDSTCFNFDDTLHGEYPDGGLCLAGGLFYGMTNSGGTTGHGVFYSYNSVSGQCNNLINFNDTDGAYAYSNVVQATDGRLYGMTEGGGVAEAGVIFRYDPVKATDTVCEKFASAIGANSFAGLVQAANGLLYGVTAYGGTVDDGVIFSYDPLKNVYKKLMDFNNAANGSGYYPNGSLLFVNDTLTSVQEIKEQGFSAKIYPVPANYGFEVNIKGVVQRLELYDMYGRKILEMKLSGTNNQQQYINTSGLAIGTYHLKIMGGNSSAVYNVEVVH